MEQYSFEEVLDPKDMGWQSQAACLGIETDFFFVEDRGHPYTEQESIKKICKGCDVRNECLAFAIKYTTLGYWGGTTEDERRAIRQNADRQRTLRLAHS